jgi:hypothetical protein
VTIIVRYNETLELNLIEYRDAISMAELKALAAFAAGRPEHMRCDALALVHPGATFIDADTAALDALFSLYRSLYATIDFQMLRRSAWICQSPAAAPQVRHWLSGDVREAMSTAVRQFETYAEAADWLVLSAAEMASVQRGEGFEEIARFADTPAPLRAAG